MTHGKNTTLLGEETAPYGAASPALPTPYVRRKGYV
jgi:hypothetical protein